VLRNAWIIASVDLPREIFAKSETHTMTSILVLQKFSSEERRIVEQVGRLPDYEIFMAIADKVGWDLRGQPVFLRTPEGEEVLRKTTRTVTGRNAKGEVTEVTREVEEPIIDDHLPSISELFAEWLNEGTPRRWMHG
jgi:type I restriction enzyme M protein